MKVVEITLIAMAAALAALLVAPQHDENVGRLLVNSKGECRAKTGGNPNFHTEVSRRTVGNRVTCSISFDKQGEEEQ